VGKDNFDHCLKYFWMVMNSSSSNRILVIKMRRAVDDEDYAYAHDSENA
jgi:hypothetical protein